MDNEPLISMRGTPESIIAYEDNSGTWVIRDCETNVTTQADSKITALLMLADALHGYHDTDTDLLEEAEDIF